MFLKMDLSIVLSLILAWLAIELLYEIKLACAQPIKDTI